ncbi:hypothetical protein BV898_19013 [Hypsibius exemplaris]|uniref:Receptor ligand binding region domain-containing protein n=1 Tax=Hypsibius exemplaris TaxID=2072580 RepID=A0A9X6NJY1_HYPEX|nr:hypothetical protein BV898_19013 [Hypsibius exemplaris]
MSHIFIPWTLLWVVFSPSVNANNGDVVVDRLIHGPSKLHVEFITTGFFGFEGHEPVSLSYNAPAIMTGVQRLRDLYPEHHWTWTFIWDTQNQLSCPLMPDHVYFMLAQYYYSRRISNRLSIVVAPACFEGIPMNDFAGVEDVLLITSASVETVIRNRQRSPTWLSTTPFAYSNVVFCSLLNALNWTTVFVGLDSQDRMYHLYIFHVVTGELTGCGVQFTAATVACSEEASVVSSLREFHAKSRVFLYFGQPPGFRSLLMVAARLGMIDGDHVFLAVVPWASPAYGFFTWQMNREDDEKVKRAYRSVLLLTMVDEEQYALPSVRLLSQEWANISRTVYNNTELTSDLPLPVMAATHAAVELAGTAVVEALARNVSFTNGNNGRVLAESILNRTRDLQVGQWRMGSTGVVVHGVQLSSLDWETGQLKAFMKALETDATFVWKRTDPHQTIWHGRADLPPAVPLCGLDGAACFSRNGSNDSVVGGSVAVICALAVLIGALLARISRIWIRSAVWWSLESDILIMGSRKSQSRASRV